jgi:hypothetical protein
MKTPPPLPSAAVTCDETVSLFGKGAPTTLSADQSDSFSRRADASRCPRCGGEGRRVPAATLTSLVRDKARARLASLDGFRFCATPVCAVAYFQPAAGELILCTDVVVPVFQKSADPARLVCYCFKHTVAEVQQEARAGGGVSRIAADIKARCAQGLDDCERNNPQGACCLGNVQRVFREAVAEAAPTSSPPEADEDGGCCCH